MLREIIEYIAPQSGFNLLAMLVSIYGVEAVEETFEEVKAAQQSVQADKCPHCAGVGRFENPPFPPNDCTFCQSTGIRR